MNYDSITPYGFYYVDREYIEALALCDTHVPKCDYEDEDRARKFYCGPVAHEAGVDYFVPVSHQIKDEMVIPGSLKETGVAEHYGISIRNENRDKTGNLDFRFMIPVVNTDYLTTIELTNFGSQQLLFCRNNEHLIKNIAHWTYCNINAQSYDYLDKTAVSYDCLLSNAFDYDDEYTEQISTGEKKESARKLALAKLKLASVTITNNNRPNQDTTTLSL